MLTKTIRFLTSVETAERLGTSTRQAERQLRALGFNPWDWEGKVHWSEQDVDLAVKHFGRGTAHLAEGDFTMGTREVAAYLGISIKLLERMAGRGLRHEIERVKIGKEWRYSRTGVDNYRAKRDRVRKEKLWRATDIGREFGITSQTVLGWFRGDVGHFPEPKVNLAGVDYWAPAEIREYKRELDKFLRLPTMSDLADRVGVPVQIISHWARQGKLPAMLVRQHRHRFADESWKEALKEARLLAKSYSPRNT